MKLLLKLWNYLRNTPMEYQGAATPQWVDCAKQIHHEWIGRIDALSELDTKYTYHWFDFPEEVVDGFIDGLLVHERCRITYSLRGEFKEGEVVIVATTLYGFCVKVLNHRKKNIPNVLFEVGYHPIIAHYLVGVDLPAQFVISDIGRIYNHWLSTVDALSSIHVPISLRYAGKPH